ncbi:MAG: hypothetical protein FJ297_08400 [Planctomycetes bacterium]|nr:hypothetical protein [Planctomycetota bacterium]
MHRLRPRRSNSIANSNQNARATGLVRFAALLAVPVCLAWPVRAEPPDGPNAEELVRQLGDLRFSVRERATEQLVRIGSDALPALDAGARHRDREIRYRSGRILTIVRKNDFQRRLEAFASDARGEKDHGLPGWRAFRDAFGVSTASRSLFVEMVRAEPALFQSLDEGPKEAAFTLDNRTLAIQQPAAQVGGEVISLGTVAAMLFVMTEGGVEPSDQASNFVLSSCFQGSFDKALSDGPNRDLVRKILGKAIEQSHDWPAYTAIRLALRYDMGEGLKPALRTFEGGQNVNIVYIRQFAILAIGRFGDRSHTDVLEPLLDDPTPCVPAQAINKQMTFETQLRDIALAVLWKLHGQDPQNHGFGDRVQEDPQLVFHPSTLGFPGDAERQAAIREWHAFRKAAPNP